MARAQEHQVIEEHRQDMSHVDHAWLRMDDPTNLMMISGVTLFDDPMTVAEMRDIIVRRLLPIARFRSLVVRGAKRGRHEWVPAPDFDVDRHIVEERLSAPGGDAELRDLVSRRMGEPLDFSQPLWMVHVVHGYGDGGAVIWRLHHCIGDGIALMLVLLSLTEMASGAPAAEPPTSLDGVEESRLKESPLRALFTGSRLGPDEAKGHLEQVMPESVKLLTKPAEKIASLNRWQKGGASVPAFTRMALLPPDPKTVFKGPLGVGKRAAWSRPVSMTDVKMLRETLGGTVNDVLTAAVAGGLRRYLVGRGQGAGRLNVRAIVPVSLRPLEEMASLGNQFGLVFLSLPVGIEDPKARLAELRKRMDKIKRSFQPVVALKILHFLGASPHGLQKLVTRIFGAKGTAVMTNVPGPRERLYMAGKPMRGFMFWVPQSARLGMGISIASYAGEVRLGIATDEGLVPDPEQIIEGFHQEFEAMKKLGQESRA